MSLWVDYEKNSFHCGVEILSFVVGNLKRKVFKRKPISCGTSLEELKFPNCSTNTHYLFDLIFKHSDEMKIKSVTIVWRSRFVSPERLKPGMSTRADVLLLLCSSCWVLRPWSRNPNDDGHSRRWRNNNSAWKHSWSH